MAQDPAFVEYLNTRSSNPGGEGEAVRATVSEPDWEMLERLTRQEWIGVAIVLAVVTAMAAVIKLSGL